MSRLSSQAKNLSLSSSAAIAFSVCFSVASPVRADFTDDHRVQPPTLGAPERGNIAGVLSEFSLAAAEVTRGSFSVPAPLDFPDARGAPLVDLTPRYSPESGLSEWGMGFSQQLAIRRDSVEGEVDYTADEFVSPWGRLLVGTDGYYYPAGFQSRLRFENTDSGWSVVDGQGHAYTFDLEVTRSVGVYAWYLTQVTNVFGEETSLDYEVNASGRPFLTEVHYGGRGSEDGYVIHINYEPLSETFSSYTSGQALELDRRVFDVRIYAENAGTTALRWRYTLEYGSELHSPVFYLDRLTRIWPSGETDPSALFTYDRTLDHLDTEVLQPISGLDAFLASGGSITPSQVTVTDFDRDGLIDLEHAFAQAEIRQPLGGGAWTIEETAASSSPDPACRRAPGELGPRTLARIHPLDAAPSVIVGVYGGLADPQTAVKMCDRSGGLINSFALPGDWTLSTTVRFTDLNADQKPELVRVGRGEIEFAENLSTTPGTYVFGPVQKQTLTPSFELDAAWIHDTSGDGVVDIVARTVSGELVSWRGTGRLAFEQEHHLLSLFSASGGVVPTTGRRVGFVDANVDGLADVILSGGGSGSLFLNTLGEFHEQLISVLSRGGPETADPMTGDFAGSGHAQLSFLIPQPSGVRQAFNLALSRSSTGLLTSIDDGMGSTVSFDYAYSAPEPGVGRRLRVLQTATVNWGSSLPVELSDFETRYEFTQAQTHSMNQELLGFEVVRRTSGPALTESIFQMEDLIPPVPVFEALEDVQHPDLAKTTSTGYASRVFQGIEWLRSSSRETAWIKPSTGEAISTSTSTTAFTREFCPTTVQSVSTSGTLTETTTLVSPTMLVDALHCLSERKTFAGTHSDASLDFTHTVETPRNERGQVVAVRSQDGAEVVELQEMIYGPNHRMATLSTPVEGTTTFGYESRRGFLESVLDPLGIQTTATFESVRDNIVALVEERDAGHAYKQWFRFDTQERLAASWDNVAGGNANEPLVAYDYRYADDVHPAAITETRAVDLNNAIHSTAVSLFYPSGAQFAQYQKTPEGWVNGSISVLDRTTQTTESGFANTLATTSDPAGQSYAQVLAAAMLLEAATSSAFEVNVQQSETIQSGVQRDLETSLIIESGQLVTTTHENSALLTRNGDAADGNRLWSEDALGNRTTYIHDALGRLRIVELPDGGQRHRWDYDGHGRIEKSERTGIGSVIQSYDPTTGLVVSQSYRDAAGIEERRSVVSYDTHGRPVERLHTLSATGASERYAFLYDGETPADESATAPSVGQTGHLTGVEGPGFSRSWVYDVAGRASRNAFRLQDGFELIETGFTYFSDGEWRSYMRRAQTPRGSFALPKVRSIDGVGRLSHMDVGGVRAFDLSYDALNRVQNVSMPTAATASSFSRTFDAVTRRENGYILSQGATDAFSSWDFDDRGLIASEQTTAAGVDTSRTFSYDARRFLVEAHSGTSGAVEAWSYDANGMLASMQDHHGSRSITRTPAQLTAGSRTYRLDSLGRVVDTGNATLSYGAHGHVALSTSASGRQATYLYNHDDQRIATSVDGVLTAAFVGDTVYTESGLLEPVEFGGRLVALIREDGEIQPVAADQRGTLAADPETGEALTLSAYGSRPNYTPITSALDFVRAPHDATSQTVRFGVRDYDPYLGQFLTPDPLFFMQPDLSLESPVEANLYGYAIGDPINRTDPTGTCASEYCQQQTQLATEAMRRGDIDAFNHHMNNRVSAVGKIAVGAFVVHGLAPGVPIVSEGMDLHGLQRDVRAGNAVSAMFNAAGLLLPFVNARTLKRFLGYGDDSVRSITDGVDNALGNVPKGVPATKHGLSYAPRVRTRAVEDPKSHNFPYSFDDGILATKPILKKNGYRIYQKRGTMTGKVVTDPKTGVRTQQYKEGVFEIGVTKDGVIDHRFFRPDN